MESKTSRVKAIELMKAVAIIGMIMVHTLEPSFIGAWYGMGLEEATDIPNFPLYFVIEIFGGIIAVGAFMFAMGWGTASSDSATPKKLIKRAVKLYLLGIFLNITVSLYIRLVDPIFFEIDSITDYLFVIVSVDIYFFAAVSMLVLAMLKKLPGLVPKLIFTAAITAICIWINISFPMGTLLSGNDWIDTGLTGLISRQNEYSCFPFANWFAFPLLGYWIGYLYRSAKDKKVFFISSALLAVVLFAVGMGVIIAKDMPWAALSPGTVDENDYYGLNIWNIMVGCALILFMMLIAFGITHLTKDRLPNFILRMSKNVMPIYIIQWLIIALIYKPLTRNYNLWLNFVIGIIIIIVTYWLAILWNRFRAHLRSKKAAD